MARAGVYSQNIVGGGESFIPRGTVVTAFSTVWQGGAISVEESHQEIVGSIEIRKHRTSIWAGSTQLFSVPLPPREAGIAGIAILLVLAMTSSAFLIRNVVQRESGCRKNLYRASLQFGIRVLFPSLV